jgi:flagellar biosynthesis/type III secretory pathway M-ring protein FliF/YscJ
MFSFIKKVISLAILMVIIIVAWTIYKNYSNPVLEKGKAVKAQAEDVQQKAIKFKDSAESAQNAYKELENSLNFNK